MKQPVTIPFVIKEMSEDQMDEEVSRRQAERVVYYTGESGRDKAHSVNVGHVGHQVERGFLQMIGRSEYQKLPADLADLLPIRAVRNLREYDLTPVEVAKLWLEYVRVTEGAAEASSAAKRVFGNCKKEDQTVLGFDRGGLKVAGEVIWILPDKQYAKEHKKAADWVLPSKDYIKRVVARHLENPKHDPEKSNIDVLKVVPGQVYSDGSVDRYSLGKFMVPVYERNPDGSYVFDKDGNRVPTGEMVEGIKMTALGASHFPRP